MKVILPKFLIGHENYKEIEDFSIYNYIQYETQCKNEVYITTNVLIFVRKGKKILHLNNGILEASPGDILFLRSGHYVMSEILDTSYEAILFMYEDTLLLDFIQKYDISFEKSEDTKDNIFKFKNTIAFEYLIESVLSYFKDASSNKESLIKLKVEEAFLNMLDSECQFKEFLYSVYRGNYFKIQIEKEFDYQENILRLAEEMNLTTMDFRKQFKEYFHTTPRKWQNEKRLEKAKILLLQGQLNVSQVCLEVGFDNISWFIQSFKRKYGITPKQIKKDKQ